MTEEQIKNWAREKANALEENQTLGIYDCDEDMRYDEGYNDGQVSGYEEGLIEGYHEGFKDCAKSRLNVTTISDCPIKNEWHDLRKDPDDLPEDTYDVLDQAGYKVHYNFFQNVWVNEKDEIDEHVIAWCEIPTFDKE